MTTTHTDRHITAKIYFIQTQLVIKLIRILLLLDILRQSIVQSQLQTDRLSTTYNGGLLQSGNMFDVVTKAEPLTIRAIDLHTASNILLPYEVYYRRGTHVNYEQDIGGGWYMIGCGSVQGKGLLNPTHVDLDFPVESVEYERVSFYVTVKGSGQGYLIYSNGGSTGNVFVENDVLQIMDGAAVTYPFGVVYLDR